MASPLPSGAESPTWRARPGTACSASGSVIQVSRPSTPAKKEKVKKSADAMPDIYRKLGKQKATASGSSLAPVPRYAHMQTLQIRPQGTATKSTNAAITVIEETLFNSPSVEVLDLRACQLLNQAVETLAQYFDFIHSHDHKHSLKILLLDDNSKIEPSSLSSLFRSLQTDAMLTTLHLNSLKAGDELITSLLPLLTSNHRITEVCLAENKISQVGAEALASKLNQTNLEHLDMSTNKFFDKGGSAIAVELGANLSLKTLKMRACRLHDEAFVNLGLAMANNRTLTSLDLEANEASESALEGFSQLMLQNTTLLHLGILTSDCIASAKAGGTITKRNQVLAQRGEPKQLEQEVVRLHYESHKMQVAKQTLREHQKVNTELDGQVQKVDGELVTAKQEMAKAAKEITQRIGFEEISIRDLMKKREMSDVEHRQGRAAAMDAAAELQRQLDAETVKSAEYEGKWSEIQGQLATLKTNRENKQAELMERIKGLRAERARLEDKAKEDRARITELLDEHPEIQHMSDAGAGGDEKPAEKRKAKRKKKPKEEKKADSAIDAFLDDM